VGFILVVAPKRDDVVEEVDHFRALLCVNGDSKGLAYSHHKASVVSYYNGAVVLLYDAIDALPPPYVIKGTVQCREVGSLDAGLCEGGAEDRLVL
jgi:hypothetical protein